MELVRPADARANLIDAFATELRALRAKSGQPSYSTLQRVEPSLRTSTISDILSARSVPSIDFVLNFVKACRSVVEVGEVSTDYDAETWRSRWLILQRDLGAIRRGAVWKSAPDDYLVHQPRQLPADARLLFGRDAELAALDKYAKEGGTIAVVGEAGVGKTSLVVRWAHENVALFPDGQLFADLRGFGPGQPESSCAVLQDLLRGLGVHPDEASGGTDAAAARFRSAVAERRLLILLDNARDSEQVRPLLPGNRAALVLVTSRFGLDALVIRDGALRLRVGALSQASSIKMLSELTGVDDAASLTRIATACEHLPLPLRVVAERMRSRVSPIAATLADELTDRRLRLDLLSGRDEDESIAVRSVLSWTYRALSPSAARAFRLLGLQVLPEFAPEAAAALFDVTLVETKRLLSILSSAHLVQPTSEGRFRQHDLLFQLAIELIHVEEPAEVRQQAETRLLAWYLHGAARADAALAPHRARLILSQDTGGSHLPELRSPSAARAWCERERHNLAAATARAEELGADEVAWQLPRLLMTWFNLAKPWSMWVETCSIAARAADRLKDSAARAGALNALGIAHRELRQRDDAVKEFLEAAEIYHSIGEQRGLALALGNLGAVEQDRGRHQIAVDYHRRAIDIFTEIGDDDGLSIALHNEAEAEIDLRHYNEAYDHAIRALAISRRFGDAQAIGSTLTTLGEALAGLHREADARAAFEEALDIRADAGDQQGLAIVLFRLGRLANRAGSTAHAYRLVQEALDVLNELEDPYAREVSAYLDGLQ